MAQNSARTARKRGPGRPFPPGVSGNEGGRPKGFGEYIREQTKGGKEIVDLVLAAMRNKRLGIKLQLQAAEFLTDRGWGRPVQQTALTGEMVCTFAAGQAEDVRAVLAERIGAECVDEAMEQIGERWQARALALDAVGK